MNISCNKNDENMEIKFDGDLIIPFAAESKEQLLALNYGENEVHFDLSSVSRIDTAGVQILMALANDIKVKNASISKIKHSDCSQWAFDLYALHDHFLNTEKQ